MQLTSQTLPFWIIQHRFSVPFSSRYPTSAWILLKMVGIFFVLSFYDLWLNTGFVIVERRPFWLEMLNATWPLIVMLDELES